MKNFKRAIFFVSVIFVSALVFSQSTNSKTNDGFASQEFRRGVQAYYRSSFNEAALLFEKTLSYKNNDLLALDWLGKSYYRSGLEGEALEAWKKAQESGYGGLLLQNKIEIVSERRLTGRSEEDVRYTEAGSFPGWYKDSLIFSEPVSVLPEKDGSAWIVAYGSNELLKININGDVIHRTRGPINGFDRPIDIIKLANGNLLVSESAGDRLSLLNANGGFVKYIGTKGRALGSLIGPQYLCQSDAGNIFVSDYGNSRVDVFDSDGNALFYFGKKDGDFAGLQGPTGIASVGNFIYVADSVTGAIYTFDDSGNFLDTLVPEKTFYRPESMKAWKNYLVICDSNKVYSVDVSTGSLYESAETGNAPTRLTSATPDVNGNILVTDMKSNEVYVMTKMSELVGGLFVQIDRVNADAFPKVTLTLRVENRHRQSLVGLKAENFFLTEGKRQVASQMLIGDANENQLQDLTIVIDRSMHASGYKTEMQKAVRDIAVSMNGNGTMRIVSAGENPSLEYSGSSRYCEQFSMNALKTPECENASLDLAFRLAANDLTKAGAKRAIVFVSDGSATPESFSRYALSEIVSYFNNNSILFSSVLATNTDAGSELSYMLQNTQGSLWYVYGEQGLGNVVADLNHFPIGVYELSFISSLPTNYGTAYLPIEAEVYLMNRSGRDESGYFAPLK